MREKPLTEFGLDRRRADGRHPYCKECRNGHLRAKYAADREGFAERQRWRTIKHLYGMSKDEWWALYSAQNGQCAICHRDLQPNIGGRMDPSKTCVDHCHETGRVRGLLCNDCNIAIGRLNHDPALLRAAAVYLT